MSSEHKRKISDLLQVNADLQTKLEDKQAEIQQLWRLISLAHNQKLRADLEMGRQGRLAHQYKIK